MRVSKFVKLSNNILLEYSYDDSNNFAYPYKILINNQNNQNNLSFIAGDTDFTTNKLDNQLFRIDLVNNTFGKVDVKNYTFLQLKDYSEGFPIRHDTLKIHLPVNYTFEEYIGFYIKVYTLDFNNKKTYELSNFYFDITDVNQSDLIELSNPSLLFQEKLWTKYLKVDIPSVDSLSKQRTSTGARPNTVNSNLTNGFGLSTTSPIFIDFHYIKSRRTINNITTYNLSSKYTTSLPQTPDFEKLGLRIEHSKRGDYFEIFGIYNGNINEFNSFILDSINYGKRYIVEYNITLFEQNIRGKSFKIVIEDNFNEKVEFRPIIKFSTTTAIIDVEMNVIDMVDGAMIQRRASYGMLQDEVAKYSLNLTKINLSRASKPKIYNIKSPEGAGIFGNLNGSAYSDGRLYGNAGGSLFATSGAKNLFGLGRGKGSGVGGSDFGIGSADATNNAGGIGVYRNSGVGSAFINNRFGTGGGDIGAENTGGLLGGTDLQGGPGRGLIEAGGLTNESGLNQIANVGLTKVVLEPYPVYFSVFSDRFEIVAKSDSVNKGKGYFYGIGKLKIVLTPFDQFVKFILATTVNPTIDSKPEYMDLTNSGEIKLVFKNTKNVVEFGLYLQTREVDLSRGVVVFKVTMSKVNEIRQILTSGINVFYITANNQGSTTVLYNGLFTIYDDKANVDELNKQQAATENQLITDAEGFAIPDPNNQATGTAVVTRTVYPAGAQGAQGAGTSNGQNGSQGTNPGQGGGGNSNQFINSSQPSTLTQGTNKYEIDTNSNLLINGYSWGPDKIKKIYSLSDFPKKLTIQQQGTIINIYTDGKLLDNIVDMITKLEKEFLKTAEEITSYKNTTGVYFSGGVFTKPTTNTGGATDPNQQSGSGTGRQADPSQLPDQYNKIENYNIIDEQSEIITTVTNVVVDNYKINDLLNFGPKGRFRVKKIDKPNKEVYVEKEKPLANAGQASSGTKTGGGPVGGRRASR